MRWFLHTAWTILIIGLSLGLVALIVFNWDLLSTLQVAPDLQWSNIPVSLPLTLATLVGLLLGRLSLRTTMQTVAVSSLRTGRKAEQFEAKAEVASDRVKTLEAKIDTLETALAKSLQDARQKSPVTE